MTSHAAVERMTVAAFLDWASRRPEGERRELIEGHPVPACTRAGAGACHGAETIAHAGIKRRIDHALGAALVEDGHDLRSRGLRQQRQVKMVCSITLHVQSG
jgi:hypothetical protein